MKKVFEMHCHCHLFDIPIGEKAEIFKEEFAVTGAEKACFLSIPQEYDDKGGKFFDGLQNIKVAFLKRYFSPNGYAYAGLVHPEDYSDEEAVAEDFFRQVTEYYDAGFDGIKMLEGYPTFIKYTRQGLDSPIYDKFYAFCEKKRFSHNRAYRKSRRKLGYEKSKQIRDRARQGLRRNVSAKRRHNPSNV